MATSPDEGGTRTTSGAFLAKGAERSQREQTEGIVADRRRGQDQCGERIRAQHLTRQRPAIAVHGFPTVTPRQNLSDHGRQEKRLKDATKSDDVSNGWQLLV